MTIELPGEIENQLREAAQVQNVSVGEYIENLVRQTSVRNAEVARFRSTVSERMSLLEAGDSVDGEEAMSRLISEISGR
jgi:predicted transcriptional regulator